MAEITKVFARYDTKGTGYVGKYEVDDVMRGSYILYIANRFETIEE